MLRILLQRYCLLRSIRVRFWFFLQCMTLFQHIRITCLSVPS